MSVRAGPSDSASARGGSALPTVTTAFKVKEPDTFHGDRRKLGAFLAQVRLKFKLAPHEFDSSAKAVLYVSAYLRDAAFDCFEPRLTDYLTNRRGSQEAAFIGWVVDYTRFRRSR